MISARTRSKGEWQNKEPQLGNIGAQASGPYRGSVMAKRREIGEIDEFSLRVNGRPEALAHR